MNSDMILVLVLHILVEVILILLLCLLHSQNKTNQIKKKKKQKTSLGEILEGKNGEGNKVLGAGVLFLHKRFPSPDRDPSSG